jgi:hypothetical protein
VRLRVGPRPHRTPASSPDSQSGKPRAALGGVTATNRPVRLAARMRLFQCCEAGSTPARDAIVSSGCSSAGRALVSGARGRRFKPCHPDHSAFRPMARTLARLARDEGSNPSGRTAHGVGSSTARARGCGPRDAGSIPVHHPIPHLHLLADASGEAIRLSNGTRWVRFPRRALRPSCVSGLRVRLKPGRSRFDSGGGHRISHFRYRISGAPSGRVTALQAEISGFDSRRLHCPVEQTEAHRKNVKPEPRKRRP